MAEVEKDQQLIIDIPHQMPEVLETLTSLSGEDVLPGFILYLKPIFV